MGGLSERPEIWAGAECAYLKVDGVIRDQLAMTGHDRRLSDIDRLVRLGANAVRVPILWGRSRSAEATDWAWAGRRIERLAERDVKPVVGLLHHGYGPPGSDPLAPDWPAAFGAFAAEVARRFPSVTDFLPLNEPLTTARFGALYGWWPPYGRDHLLFGRLLVAESLAISLAAAAIRAATPSARIIVNEDIGRTFGTADCRPVVEFDNERRWLTFDLACGLVDRSHALWTYLATSREQIRRLDRLRDAPVAPEVLGIDHYITSDRYLDHRLSRYPEACHGGDGRLRYADVELVRVRDYEVDGFRRSLAETWRRYGRPMALTEVALAGEPHDQVAWWNEAWAAASGARSALLPVVAVNAWSVFGSFGWSDLLRDNADGYEPGCYDVSGGRPRPTELAAAVAASARGLPPDPRPGWWRTDARSLYPVSRRITAA
jgi:dTDP-4-dehydrorhamnose reductase